MENNLIKGIGNRELYYLSNKNNKQYHKIIIPKKNASSRTVYAPSKNLKWCQKQIAETYLNDYRISVYATAYRKNISIIDNAKVHSNKKYILKLDIENFFESIDFNKVYNMFYLRYPKHISKLFAELCTYKDSLVQGSPASPLISNIIMYDIDNIIGAVCRERGVAYTRYCDDLTFSSDKKLYEIYHIVKRLLSKYGFYLNRRKTHFVNNNHQQNVTGIVVNKIPQVSSKYRRKLRQEIYYCKKYGVKNHIEHLKLKYDICEYLYKLKGKIIFVLSVNKNDKEFMQYQIYINDLIKCFENNRRSKE